MIDAMKRRIDPYLLQFWGVQAWNSGSGWSRWYQSGNALRQSGIATSSPCWAFVKPQDFIHFFARLSHCRSLCTASHQKSQIGPYSSHHLLDVVYNTSGISQPPKQDIEWCLDLRHRFPFVEVPLVKLAPELGKVKRFNCPRVIRSGHDGIDYLMRCRLQKWGEALVASPTVVGAEGRTRRIYRYLQTPCKYSIHTGRCLEPAGIIAGGERVNLHRTLCWLSARGASPGSVRGGRKRRR